MLVKLLDKCKTAGARWHRPSEPPSSYLSFYLDSAAALWGSSSVCDSIFFESHGQLQKAHKDQDRGLLCNQVEEECFCVRFLPVALLMLQSQWCQQNLSGLSCLLQHTLFEMYVRLAFMSKPFRLSDGQYRKAIVGAHANSSFGSTNFWRLRRLLYCIPLQYRCREKDWKTFAHMYCDFEFICLQQYVCTVKNSLPGLTRLILGSF